MIDIKIGIVGGGAVGGALCRAWREFTREVCVWDKELERRTNLLTYTLNSDLIFLCLPEADIEPFFASADPGTRLQGHWVIKSTVPIGTTRRLAEKYDIPNIVHSPEFLTERVAESCARVPSVLVIGGSLNQAALRLRRFYEERYPGTSIHMMSSNDSEAVKLFLNATFAVKVALFNELHCYAEKMNLNWDLILPTMLADGRITPEHTKVPGPDGMYGFGGRCLPKDTETLARQIGEANLGGGMIRQALVCNERDRKRPK